MNIEFARQTIDECFCSFYLQLCGISRFTIGNNTDSDGSSAIACTPGRRGSVLPVPSVSSLNDTIFGAETVADNKVAIKVLGIGKTGERGKLLDVPCVRAAVEDFDTVPMSRRLDKRSKDSFLNWVKAVVT